MAHIIQLAGISGSLRKGSFNTALLHAVHRMLPDHMKMNILSIADIPLYNADLDWPAVAERPAPVARFREDLANTDAVLIVSPEYNYSIPGGLKNAIDWASRGEDSPLLGKPVAVMGATQGLWGTVRMHLAFHPVFQFLNMKPLFRPEILVAKAKDKFDAELRLSDEPTIQLIQKHLKAFSDHILHSQMQVSFPNPQA
ncbi:NADPH-dependent FMN reductase [Pseudoflavitalea rhizosphaerae]|uniref:NADPH-dependent FMN reductase n=1 Tax=Pseudoflavitalea rhizosphaerae TaxID=1884793 RepID=UPI000F8E7738|nr:NAD(P)H-dependent oxidoreductase [Pseudoflavitalea rhizosphaerae]